MKTRSHSLYVPVILLLVGCTGKLDGSDVTQPSDASNPTDSHFVGPDASPDARTTTDAAHHDALPPSDTPAVDVAPPDPVSCSLPASDIGVWRDVTPPEFHQPANMQPWSLAVNPHDETVFAAGGNITNGCGQTNQPPCVGTGVFKSTDCGGTWHLVSTGRSHDVLATGDPWALRIDPLNTDTMYVNNGYGQNPTLFKSTNGGVDWDPLNPDSMHLMGISNFVQAVAIDPSPARHGHLVVTFHENCDRVLNPNCLADTTDGGETWREFSGPAELTGWAEASSISILNEHSYLLGTPAGWGAFFTSDGGDSWTKVMIGPAYGSYGGGADIAPDGTAYFAIANTGVFYSRATPTSPLGASWTQIPGSPMGSLVFDDGVNLFLAWGWYTGGMPYATTPLATAASTSPQPMWTTMQSTNLDGPNMAGYDPVHHIVYVISPSSGIARLVTR